MAKHPKLKDDVRKMLIIQWLANPEDTRTQSEIAKTVGISAQTIINWKKDREFVEMVYAKAVDIAGYKLPEIIHAQVQKAIKKQNTNAARFVMEICGKMEGNIKGVKTSNNEVNITFDNRVPRPNKDEPIDVGDD